MRKIGKLGKLGHTLDSIELTYLIDEINLIIEKQGEIIDCLNSEEDMGWQLKKLTEFVERQVEKAEKRGFRKAIDIFEKSKGPDRLIEEWLKYLKSN